MKDKSNRAIRTISPATARRLAIFKQQLAGSRPTPDAHGMLDTIRALGCLQLDPINVVLRSHLMVLFSRLGQYDPAHLDDLLFKDRHLFEYWAHEASIVLMEDYPIHQAMMAEYRAAEDGSGQTAQFLRANHELRQHILDEMAAKGPRLSRDFEDKAAIGWTSSGWTGGRNVSRMLHSLWTRGYIMVAGRKGIQKVWDLTERILPEWAPRDQLGETEVVRLAAQKSLRALGVATQQHINKHYIRNRYPNLKAVLANLEQEGVIQRIQVGENAQTWRGDWYIHCNDVPLLEQIEAGDWQPRTTLLSPFDNLICDRTRTELMFNFNFRIEIYVPKHLRQYGYYVLPILHGDQLIGRIDPTMDRKNKQLLVNAVYAEQAAPMDKKTAKAIAGNIEELAAFLGAKKIVYGDNIPPRWKATLT